MWYKGAKEGEYGLYRFSKTKGDNIAPNGNRAAKTI